jgi:cell division protein FtsQ
MEKLQIKKFRLKTQAKIGLVAIGLLIALGFASRQYARVSSGTLLVRIDSVDENKFITEAEVVSLITEIRNADSTTSPTGFMNLKEVERKLRAYSFIADCQVARDLQGNLVVDVKQRKPLARAAAHKGGGFYMASNGGKMPLSAKFTARVPILTGAGADSLYLDEKLTMRFGQPMFKFLTFMDDDPFWKAQIAQVEMDKYGNVSLYPQVGNQVIEMGMLTDFEAKLKKLKLFYEKIVPVKGWDAYKKVKLDYDNQIVCE